jgi:hypothetical protein
MSPPIIPPARTPVPVDHLAAIPPDLGTRPIPRHRPCDDPRSCGADGTNASLCPPCRDVVEWQAIQRERLAERERLNPALRELQALAKHFPDLIAEALLPAMAEGIGMIVASLIQGGRRRGR